jgi:hypothetical protein
MFFLSQTHGSFHIRTNGIADGALTLKQKKATV